MKIATLAVIVLTHSIASSAATLAPESLVCEAAESIAFVSRTSHLAGQSGPKVIFGAKGRVESAEIQRKLAGSMRSLAGQEAAIANERYARPADRRANTFEGMADKAEAGVAPYVAIMQTCASSGATPLNVEVLDRTPISGIAKISISVKGRSAQVFTASSAVSD